MSLTWRADRNPFVETFSAFCGASLGLNGAGFLKLCKHTFLLDEHLTAFDADQLFLQVLRDGEEEISLSQFEEALQLIAEKKGLPLETIQRAVTMTAGPTLRATCAAAGVLDLASRNEEVEMDSEVRATEQN